MGISFDNIKTILRRELRGYFNSPIAYIVVVIFLIINGWFFASSIFLINEVTLDNFLGNMPLLFIFFIPAMTMGLFSDEIKSGTIEILATMPLKDEEIIIGKFLSAFSLMAVAISLTLIHPITLMFLGKVDMGQVIGSYSGLYLLSASFVSAGVFCSALTKNQIVAFIISFIICFVSFMFGKILSFVPAFIVSFIEYLSIDYHFGNISKGIIDSRDLIYYFSVILFFYYMTVSVLGSRRWK
ncbi:MAG: hypothetical protein A2452_00695 [Candidatus Firestonebacteria bacterium RIFOXYC2_FULL_39_67]|nr:MAG: hypothetical protein A2536_06245 [Candidatus Firestonebacteria bacterium RIFOXYD2_FULL_39_29]OGF53536.1 MAG: hypothetical protein A2497_07715 [Candidatus Firestonebacteria bacterium RifOxyC12_full_39_7]OGF56075.1 MAG: hypothetical protein A2452_00695 [Candidatus Firestonebacteria bacterium RIFOXYC2_FULL_39_67]